MEQHSSVKARTTSYLRLDVRKLQQKGLLKSGPCFVWRWSRDDEVLGCVDIRTEANRVLLSYKAWEGNGQRWVRYEYPVSVEWPLVIMVECKLGSVARPWDVGAEWPFYTEAEFSRVPVATGFLTTARMNRSMTDPDAERRIRMKLGGSQNLFAPLPLKPKGMHWRTYERLRTKAEQAKSRSWPPWLLQL